MNIYTLAGLRAWTRRNGAALLAVAGGALVIAGTLLPWFTLFAGLHRYPGTTGLYGRLLLGGGLIVLAGGIRLGFAGGRALSWSVGGLGLVLLGFAAWLARGLLEVHQQMTANPMLVARLGPGLFVSMAGAALATGTLVVFYLTSRAQVREHG
jgi:hypothetical protein